MARLAKKFSQAHLAELIGIDASVLGRIEAGKVGLEVPRLITIASLLGVTTSWLMGENGAEGPKTSGSAPGSSVGGLAVEDDEVTSPGED